MGVFVLARLWQKKGIHTGQNDMNLCSLGWCRWGLSLQGHKFPMGDLRIRGPKRSQHLVKMHPPAIPVIKHLRLRRGSLILFLFRAVFPREYKLRLLINRRIGDRVATAGLRSRSNDRRQLPICL